MSRDIRDKPTVKRKCPWKNNGNLPVSTYIVLHIYLIVKNDIYRRHFVVSFENEI